MTQKDFLGEFGSIINLLRDHSFLLYSEAGAREYREKTATAGGYFVDLVFRETGIQAPLPDHSVLPMDRIKEATWNEAVSLSKRAEAYCRGKVAEKATGDWKNAADIWRKVHNALKGKREDR